MRTGFVRCFLVQAQSGEKIDFAGYVVLSGALPKITARIGKVRFYTLPPLTKKADYKSCKIKRLQAVRRYPAVVQNEKATTNAKSA